MDKKISLILDSLIKEHEYRYLKISEKGKSESVKLKTNVDVENLKDFLDATFDQGFIVEKIDRKDFNEDKGDDITSFIVNK